MQGSWNKGKEREREGQGKGGADSGEGSKLFLELSMDLRVGKNKGTIGNLFSARVLYFISDAFVSL